MYSVFDRLEIKWPNYYVYVTISLLNFYLFELKIVANKLSKNENPRKTAAMNIDFLDFKITMIIVNEKMIQICILQLHFSNCCYDTLNLPYYVVKYGNLKNDIYRKLPIIIIFLRFFIYRNE
ncbi:hypothetical protein BpHYR1_041191, partial [Brachionus plicatilis]